MTGYQNILTLLHGLFQLSFVYSGNLLTYSMVQSPSWEANWFAASQEIPRISRNPKVHYRTHKRPPSVPILGQPNPVIYPHPTSWRSVLILSTHLRLGLPSGPLPSGFPTKTLSSPLSSSIRATCYFGNRVGLLFFCPLLAPRFSVLYAPCSTVFSASVRNSQRPVFLPLFRSFSLSTGHKSADKRVLTPSHKCFINMVILFN